MGHHVFLSYSREDAPMMRRIKVDLKAAGLRVWTDEGIEVGTVSWKEAIEKAIVESETIAVLMSPDSNKSKWVQREIDYAELHNVKLIPLLIRGEPKDAVPFALIGSQYVDLRSDYKREFKQVVRRVRGHLRGHGETTIKSTKRRDDDKTIVAQGSRRDNQSWLKTGSALVAVMLFLGAALFFGLTGSNISDALSSEELPDVPDVENPLAAVTEDANVRLRYNQRSLVVQNIGNEPLNLRNVRFELYAGEGDSPEQTYRATEWQRGIYSLDAGHCVQAWDLEQGVMSSDEPPADECDVRERYRATYTTFWRSDAPRAAFQVWRGDAELTTCSATDVDAITTCDFHLPPNP